MEVEDAELFRLALREVDESERGVFVHSWRLDASVPFLLLLPLRLVLDRVA